MDIFYTMEVGISGNDVNKHYITNLSMVKIYENDGLQVDFSKQLVINFKPYGEEDKSVSNLNWFTRNNNKQFGDTEMEAIFKINTYFPDEPVNLIQMRNEIPIEYVNKLFERNNKQYRINNVLVLEEETKQLLNMDIYQALKHYNIHYNEFDTPTWAYDAAKLFVRLNKDFPDFYKETFERKEFFE